MNDQITTTVVTSAHKLGAGFALGGYGITLANVTEFTQMVAGVTGAIIGVWTLCDMLLKWWDKHKKRVKND